MTETFPKIFPSNTEGKGNISTNSLQGLPRQRNLGVLSPGILQWLSRWRGRFKDPGTGGHSHHELSLPRVGVEETMLAIN